MRKGFNKFFEFLGRNSVELLVGFMIIYSILPFIAPTAYKLGYDSVGDKIYTVYKYLCHQRVERSLFLYGKDSPAAFYSIDDLQDRRVIPQVNTYVPRYFSEDVFGYPYIGNEEIGYKVAFCIRDTGMYIGLCLTALIMIIRWKRDGKIMTLRWQYIIALMMPMAIDGVFQLFAEMFRWSWVPQAYIDDIPKRIITGMLFGAGFSLFIFAKMKEAIVESYEEREKIKSGV